MDRHWESGGDTEGIRPHPASPPRSSECMFWKLRQSLVAFVAFCWEADFCSHYIFARSD